MASVNHVLVLALLVAAAVAMPKGKLSWLGGNAE